MASTSKIRNERGRGGLEASLYHCVPIIEVFEILEALWREFMYILIIESILSSHTRS